MSNVNQFSGITPLSTIPYSLIYIALSALNPLRTHLQRRVLLLVFVRQSLKEATWSVADCVDEKAHGGSIPIDGRRAYNTTSLLYLSGISIHDPLLLLYLFRPKVDGLLPDSIS